MQVQAHENVVNYEKKDSIYVEAMMKKHERLVYSQVEKLKTMIIKRSILEYEDAVQIGKIALWEAIERFDESLGYQFSTFAVSYIRGRLLTNMNDNPNNARVPKNNVALLERMKTDGAIELTENELVKKYNLSLEMAKTYYNLLRNSGSSISLDAPRNNDESEGNPSSLKDTLIDDYASYDEVEAEILEEGIFRNFNGLEKRVYTLLKQNATQEEIEERLNLKPERSKYFTRRIRKKTAQYLKKLGYDNFIEFDLERYANDDV